MIDFIRAILTVYVWIGALFWGLLLFLISVFLSYAVKRFSKRVEHKFTNPTEVHFATSLIQIVIYLLAVVIYANIIPGLKSLGTTLLAGAGVISMAIGFAAQNVLGNLIAGLHLIFYHPIKEGDIVQVFVPTGAATAKVETISLGYTLLTDTSNGNEIMVPNNLMVNNTIVKIVK